MNRIMLADLVDPALVIDQTEPESSGEPSQFSPANSKPIGLPVPDNLKFFGYPADINSFLSQLYPNMLAFAQAKLNDREQACDTVNEFVAYILATAPTRNNERRWRLYDVDSYSKMPYFKWIISQLHFFCRTTNKNGAIALRNVALVDSYEEAVETPANQAVTMDMLVRFDPSDNPIEMIVVQQVSTALELYSARHRGRFCFESHAYDLFVARMSDLSNQEIAERFHISTSAVGQWLAKLRPLILEMLDTGPIPQTRTTPSFLQTA